MLDDFDIEFVKLQNGQHHYTFALNDAFFEEFKNSEIHGASIVVEIDVVKSDNLLVADIYTKGQLKVYCDRCLGVLNYPVSTQFKTIYHLNSLVEKVDEAAEVNVDIVYLNGAQYKINVAHAVYESFLTALPMVKKCEDVEGNSCDMGMLQKLSKEYKGLNEEESTDPRWDDLKKWLENNK